MARKKSVVTTIEEIPNLPEDAEAPATDAPPYGEPASDEMGEDMPDELRQMAGLLDDLDAENGIRVQVFRQPGNGRYSTEWLTDMDATGMSTADIYRSLQESYGAGNYRLMVRIPGPSGLRRNRVVRIGAPLAAPVVASASSQPSELARIIETMNNGFQAMAAKLAERPPQPDPIQQMGVMFEMMRKLREATEPPATASKRDVDPIKTLRDTLALKRELEDEVPARGNLGMSDILFELVRGFAKNINFAALAPALQGAMAGQPVPAALPQWRAPAPPRPASPGGVAPAPTPAPTPAEPPAMAIPPAFQTMIFAAQNGVPADSFVDLLLDNCPKDSALALKLLQTEAPALLDQIAATRPDLANLREWFEKLRLLAIEDLSDIEDEPEFDADPMPAQNGHDFASGESGESPG